MKIRNKQQNLVLISALSILLMAGCVSQNKYQDIVDKRDACQEEKEQLLVENERLYSKYKEQSANLENCKKQLKGLRIDTAVLSANKRRLRKSYNEVYASYELLKKKREEQLAQSKEEAASILADLQKTQENILKQRDSLNRLERRIKEKESNLAEMSQELSAAQAAMADKEKRLNELQSILDRKDSVVNALKNKVNAALRGFEGEGLSIEQRNGKVYVSMDEKLLFASGSYNISSQGKRALSELGNVLEKNKDINVMVEGHTDSVPYSGKGQLKDNWDLSVKRATTIIRVLTNKSTIDPERLIAAGRSKYVPVASNKTKQGRAKNRRTEIILTPKLDKLFDIIERN
jgi:chemotaxis protein MotB